MANRFLDRVLHWLALLGFTIHESKRTTLPDSERVWGPPQNGFALSAHWFRPDLLLGLKNTGNETRTLRLSDWLVFFRVRIDAPVSPYGRRLLSAAAEKPSRTITLKPGETVDADLPLERLFDLTDDHTYQLVVACDLGILSNPVEIVL